MIGWQLFRHTERNHSRLRRSDGIDYCIFFKSDDDGIDERAIYVIIRELLLLVYVFELIDQQATASFSYGTKTNYLQPSQRNPCA